MKESLLLAVLLLAALLLIPLVVLGGDNGSIANPFDSAKGLLNSDKTNSGAANESDSPTKQGDTPADLDPNADAKAALDALLAQQGGGGSQSGTAEQSGVVDGFKILDKTTGEVASVSARDYVIGAVASEMPASFSEEALKAQAVAAHTYALRRKLNEAKAADPALKGADFDADPSKYKGYMTEELARVWFGNNFDVYWNRIVTACDAVMDEVLVYDNQPIVAAYHSMSAGLTESAETVWSQGVPYLVPVESTGDTLANNYEVQTDVTADEVKGLLAGKYPEIELPSSKAAWFEIKSRSDSGTITQLAAGDVTMTGQEARELFTLRSANFTVEYANGKFTFTTLGYGHGVGLSQYGADYMARQGSTYDEILLHYYSGASIVSVHDLNLG